MVRWKGWRIWHSFCHTSVLHWEHYPFRTSYELWDSQSVDCCNQPWCRPGQDMWWSCEISTRKNEYQKFRTFMDGLKKDGGIMVGYNNLHFDYPIIWGTMCLFSQTVCLNGSLNGVANMAFFLSYIGLALRTFPIVDDFDKLLNYNKHDIRATELFFDRCRSAVEIRHKLTAKTGINHLNWSDTTIGEKQYAPFRSLIILFLNISTAFCNEGVSTL
jgi:hypothetical protein